MAVVDAVVPSPSPPRPAMVSQQARSRLAIVAADAVMCLCFASSCTLFASFASMVIGKRVHGEDWPVAESATMITFVATLCCILTFFATVMLLIDNVDMAKLPLRVILGDTVIAAAIGFVAFALLGIAGALLLGFPENKGSPRGRIGSVMVDVGGLGMQFVYWIIGVPTLALRMRRMRRDAEAQFEIKV
ncbi:unnamed protein product [Urochloa humidicola]